MSAIHFLQIGIKNKYPKIDAQVSIKGEKAIPSAG